MNTQKRFWTILAAAVLSLGIIACSCGSLIPTLISTPTTSIVVPPDNTTGYDSLPYSDDFNDPNSGWDIYSGDNVDEGYRDGYYFLSSKTTDYVEDGYANKFFGDTVIEVDATPVSGIESKDFDYGLSCRVQSNYDGYDFWISTDGFYAVYYVTDGGSTSHSLLQGDEFQASSAVKQGYETNHLKVTCNGNQLKFEVNGVVVYEGQDTNFSEGDLRFSTQIYESTPNEVHYDHLSVTAP